MSEDDGWAERFLCALFATVVKPISDLRLLISGLCVLRFACLPRRSGQRRSTSRASGRGQCRCL